jgi:hypothetical protein
MTTTDAASVCADFFNINGRCHDLNIVETELTALCNNFAIYDNHTAAIVEQSITIASLEVAVKIYTTAFPRCFSDQA